MNKNNLKKYYLNLMICTVLFSSIFINTAQAKNMAFPYVKNVLNKISGNWYDNNGNLVISVKGEYVNDCLVVGGNDFVGGNPGSGYFWLNESQGIRKMYIFWDTVGNPPYIEIDNSGILLHR